MRHEKLPFLLPHEWLSNYFLQPGAVQEALPPKDSSLGQQLQRVKEAWDNREPKEGREPEQGKPMVPLGLHGDGVPVQGRMNQSTADFITVNLLASNTFASMRVPITCVESRFHAGSETAEAVHSVIAWSLQSLGEGIYPHCRHDGGSLDKARKQKAGKPMPARGGLVQLRGDWDWNCKWFGCPQWNEKNGMCWLCKAKPEEWRGMSAEDRKASSLNKAEFLECLERRGKHVSPLLMLPGVCNKTIKPDWMHVVDEGCAAHAAGMVLQELLRFTPDRGVDSKARRLWEEIQSLYKAKAVPASRRLSKLTAKDICKPGKAPQLAAKAAECRYFCQDILLDLVDSKGLHMLGPHERAVHNVARYLARMYGHMENFDSKKLQKYGEKFISQYMALEAEALHEEDNLTWHSKPKIHFLGHILDEAREGMRPKDSWNYRDETEGYQFQKLWFRRGGRTTKAEKVLLKWAHEQPFLSLKEAQK